MNSKRSLPKLPILLIFAAILVGCGPSGDPPVGAQPAVETPDRAVSGAPAGPGTSVDEARILAADDSPGDWLTHGRTYSEQRYSPLAGINADNVDRLGLAWHYDFETHRGMEATPLIVDGVMFTTGSWSRVYAHEATTGRLLWSYDPEVPPEWAVHLCCDVVNRGVALWGGRVFVGTLDGRLIALDAADGSVLWSVRTTDPERPYSITGAPRVVKGRVIIGNGGAEFGVRGYVSAFDADTGKQLWRFYTVPGNPEDGFENDAMARAAETWKGGEWWKIGGGGTVWDSMAYDPELDLLYIGVGNGSPWNQYIRSSGGGDNLYLSSIVALRPDTGEYVWHYQTTPGDRWDYTATQHMILADLTIGGVPRKVIMQAPKNGFFYVIDRATGEFLSAEPFVPVNWASGIDPATGRPILTETADYSETPQFTMPSPYGGHNWHPMAFNPNTGLVYLPAQEIPFVYGQDGQFEYTAGFWNTGVDLSLASLPDDPDQQRQLFSMVRARLAAWDPVAQSEVWRAEYPAPWNGGVLTSAGDLVFQGAAHGFFFAYRADDGERLWSFPAQTGIVAPPVTFEVDGRQYVTVVAGWGGVLALSGGALAKAAQVENRSRILTFALDADDQLPALPPPPETPRPPARIGDGATIALGKRYYHARCAACHGDAAIGGGVLPDLRHLTPEGHRDFYATVLGGLHRDRGMVGFASLFSATDVEAIHAYVIDRANAERAGMAASADGQSSTGNE